MNERQRALLATAFGVSLLSPDALVLRWITADPLHVVAWRGILMAAGMGFVLTLRYRGRFMRALVRCGWTGAGCAACYCASTICFLQAINLAGAASTLMIYSVSPLVAGIASWVWLGERLPLRTIVAIAVSAIGITLIVIDDSPGSDLFGNLLALAGAVLFALNFTLARSRASVDMSPALLPGALMAAGFALAWGGRPALDGVELAVLSMMAGVLLPLGFILVQLGPRRLGAAEVGLLLLLEVVLGPIWVWLVLGEAPGPMVLAGGAVVIAALAGHALAGWRSPA
jgi:drug/metabolite transporter (DMT)-like permease